jgi:hypothetical protein
MPKIDEQSTAKGNNMLPRKNVQGGLRGDCRGACRDCRGLQGTAGLQGDRRDTAGGTQRALQGDCRGHCRGTAGRLQGDCRGDCEKTAGGLPENCRGTCRKTGGHTRSHIIPFKKKLQGGLQGPCRGLGTAGGPAAIAGNLPGDCRGAPGGLQGHCRETAGGLQGDCRTTAGGLQELGGHPKKTS